MAAHPEVQKKVQKELDEAIGRGNAPTVNDCLQLPYLEATWKESIRMTPPGPLGKLTFSSKSPYHLLAMFIFRFAACYAGGGFLEWILYSQRNDSQLQYRVYDEGSKSMGRGRT